MAKLEPIRTLTVEDHPVFREGLGTIIGSQKDMRLVAQATNAVEAMAEFLRHRPDITLMDLRLPQWDGRPHRDPGAGPDSDGEIQRPMRVRRPICSRACRRTSYWIALPYGRTRPSQYPGRRFAWATASTRTSSSCTRKTSA